MESLISVLFLIINYNIYVPYLHFIIFFSENWTEKPRMIVSNHLRDTDIIAVRGEMNVAAISPLYYQSFLITKQMVKSIHPLYVSYTDRQVVRDSIQEHLKSSDIPILCFPEVSTIISY